MMINIENDKTLLAEIIRTAVEDYRSGDQDLCPDCLGAHSIADCAADWLCSRECGTMCELLGIDHAAMVQELGIEEKE